MERKTLDELINTVYKNYTTTERIDGQDRPLSEFGFSIAVREVIQKLYAQGVTMEEAIELIRYEHTEDQAATEMTDALQRFVTLREVFNDVEPDFKAADAARQLLMSTHPDAWMFRVQGNGMNMLWTSICPTDWMSEAELPSQLARAMRDGKLNRFLTPLFAGETKDLGNGHE
jgi:uncharacterized protein YoaH (UPF0181 family)